MREAPVDGAGVNVRAATRLVSLLLASLLLLSGCLQDADTEEEDEGIPEPDPETPRVRVYEESRGAEVSQPAVLPMTGTVGEGWTIETPLDLLAFELELEWTAETNHFGLRVATPSGTEEFPAPSGDARHLDAPVDDLSGGTYRVHATAEGVVLPDQLTLNVTFRWLEASAEVVEEGGWIVTERSGDQWEARIVYEAEGPVGDSVEVTVDTFNGQVEAGPSEGQNATVRITAWARAATESDAVAKVKTIETRLKVCCDEVVGEASAPSGENIGAHVHVTLPVPISGGSLSTSNGAVTLQGLTVSTLDVHSSNGAVALTDLQASNLGVDTSNAAIEASGVSGSDLAFHTSNGAIEGDVSWSGPLKAETSNGRVGLDLTPTATGTLAVRSSNGGIVLALAEGSKIAYSLDATTSNGDITESMDEASLEGDEDAATLTTSGGSGRSIQVTGTVDTSNGEIEYSSL